MTKMITIKAPELLRATLQLPASKSISNRALVMSALAGRTGDGSPSCGGLRLPDNLSDCDDTRVMLQALAEWERVCEERGRRNDFARNDEGLFEERGAKDSVIDVGAAGTAMRFLTAFLAVSNSSFTLTGTERMKRRPIGILVEALRQLGADIAYAGEEGFPPLKISGRALDGGTVEMASNVSSQFISALLMIAPVLRDGLELRLKGEVVSRPYIDLTLWMMREFGADADWSSGDTIVVKPRAYRQRTYWVENDWSAASYGYEMVALSTDEDAEIRLSGLLDGSKQGDAAVRYIFSMLGVKTEFVSGNEVILRKSNRVAPRFDYDFTNSPDLVQTVVVTCAAKGIPFHFRGLQNLKIKETDRLEALVCELKKVGFVLRVENGSELVWDGERCEPTFEPIDTYEDHRMALSFAPLALVFPSLKIRNPQVVTKSYPTFWEELESSEFIVNSE